MEVMGIKISLKMEYRDPLAYGEEHYDNILIDNLVNNPEYLQRFLVLENRLGKLDELGI
jgi:hypothetical protein